MQNKTALFAALDKVVNGRIVFIEETIAAGYLTAELARPDVMEYVSAKTDCPLKTQGSGRIVFDDAGGNAASARSMLRDLMNWMVAGASRRQAVATNKAASAKASPKVSRKAAPLTAAQKAAVAALVAAFGGDRKAARSAV
jgi:hypothetical protein